MEFGKQPHLRVAKEHVFARYHSNQAVFHCLYRRKRRENIEKVYKQAQSYVFSPPLRFFFLFDQSKWTRNFIVNRRVFLAIQRSLLKTATKPGGFQY